MAHQEVRPAACFAAIRAIRVSLVPIVHPISPAPFPSLTSVRIPLSIRVHLCPSVVKIPVCFSPSLNFDADGAVVGAKDLVLDEGALEAGT
jgi:hypothetical protein